MSRVTVMELGLTLLCATLKPASRDHVTPASPLSRGDLPPEDGQHTVRVAPEPARVWRVTGAASSLWK